MSIELSCPYTGKTVRVETKFGIPGRPVIYYQVGAWSPNRDFRSEAEARSQMLRRGREWLPDKGQKLRCPYTGAKISFIDVPGGVRPVGMYDPDRCYADGKAIYYALGMRGGVPAAGTVPSETPHTLEVKYADDQVPFEIRQMEEQSARARTDGLAAIKEAAAPVVAEVLARRN